MLVDKHSACFHLFRVHGIGFGYFRDEGFLQLYSMVKGPSRGKFPSLWLIKDFGVFGILWGKFLFHSFGGLGQGGRESELLNMGVIFPEHSEKSCHISLLSIDSGSKLGVLRMLDRHGRTLFFLLLGRAILTKRPTSFQ